jgi:thymidylate kinase
LIKSCVDRFIFSSIIFQFTTGADLDFSRLTAHQSKTLEMETQVRLLKLESQVEAERTKLAELRRKNYKTGSDGVEQ